MNDVIIGEEANVSGFGSVTRDTHGEARRNYRPVYDSIRSRIESLIMKGLPQLFSALFCANWLVAPLSKELKEEKNRGNYVNSRSSTLHRFLSSSTIHSIKQ